MATRELNYRICSGWLQVVNWPPAALFSTDHAAGVIRRLYSQENQVPLVTIEVIKDVFAPEQRAAIITKITDAMVSIEGEPMRPHTWVRIVEIEQGDWGIGGHLLRAADVKAIAAG
jgi:4-oxalocrotonate tautomerase